MGHFSILRLSLLALAVLALPGLAFKALEARQAGEHGSTEMVLIPGGVYTPLYGSPTDTSGTRLQPFYLDEHAVTNAEYLAFVKANPAWRRSQVKPLFADAGYLKHWRGDLDLGPDALADRPVVNVSWFAATAYARWAGKRLPTTAEWELVAAASATRPDGSADPTYYQHLVDWYTRPDREALAPVTSRGRNYYGVYDMHGLIWEWVADFNSAVVHSDTRSQGGADVKLFCGAAALGVSDAKDYAAFVRYAFRSGIEGRYTVPNLGFRCARNRTVR